MGKDSQKSGKEFEQIFCDILSNKRILCYI